MLSVMSPSVAVAVVPVTVTCVGTGRLNHT